VFRKSCTLNVKTILSLGSKGNGSGV